jgi:3-hydroxyacyl-CoA dehydrogenase / enoyl-CoA hydratase / 3-hydroxybutyryl-CoA epimerase
MAATRWRRPKCSIASSRSPTARNLLRVFHLQERLKGFGKDSDFVAKHVHVVGAGVMGGDIAAWCALRGLTVTLQDQSWNASRRRWRAHALFGQETARAAEAACCLRPADPDPAGAGVAHADVVIEAIFENLEAKHALFRAIEPR